MRDEARGEYLKPSVRERKAEFSRKQVSCLKKIPPYTGDGFLVGRKMVKSSFLSTDSYNCTRLADHLSKFEILTSKSNNRSIIPRIIGDDFSIEAHNRYFTDQRGTTRHRFSSAAFIDQTSIDFNRGQPVEFYSAA